MKKQERRRNVNLHQLRKPVSNLQMEIQNEAEECMWWNTAQLDVPEAQQVLILRRSNRIRQPITHFTCEGC